MYFFRPTGLSQWGPQCCPKVKACPTCSKRKIARAEEILSPVQFAKLAAPIVKNNGSIRICGDFKVTIK